LFVASLPDKIDEREILRVFVGWHLVYLYLNLCNCLKKAVSAKAQIVKRACIARPTITCLVEKQGSNYGAVDE
jgi:hypothetical protein